MTQGAPTSGQEMQAATKQPEHMPGHISTTGATCFDFRPVLQPHARSEWRRRRCRQPTSCASKPLIFLCSVVCRVRIPPRDSNLPQRAVVTCHSAVLESCMVRHSHDYRYQHSRTGRGGRFCPLCIVQTITPGPAPPPARPQGCLPRPGRRPLVA